ncbi:MAG: hypothetical protein IKJ43_01540 [Bacilli bacterium]|nr:hypothetical protein [Bacilli bacterium]
MLKSREQIALDRIKHNEKVIEEAKERREKYKIIRGSIAAAALLTSTLGVAMYRHAPVDGVLFYRVGYNDTEMVSNDFNYIDDQEFYESKNGRLMTREGIRKSYITPGDTETGTTKVSVSLPQIVSKTNANKLVTERIELEDGVTGIVRTVPTSDESLKDGVLVSGGVLGTIVDLLVSNKYINETYSTESRFNIKNRKIKRKIRRNKR